MSGHNSVRRYRFGRENRWQKLVERKSTRKLKEANAEIEDFVEKVRALFEVTKKQNYKLYQIFCSGN